MNGVVGFLYRLAWRVLPDSLIARILPSPYRYGRHEIPQPTPAPVASTRLFIGPTNFAGQGFLWARAAERIDGVATTSMQYTLRNSFGFQVDESVPVGVYMNSRTWQRSQWGAISTGYTHVLIEAERALCGQKFQTILDTSGVVAETEALRAAGLKVAFVCHGSDIRLPSRHARLHADSPYALGLLTSTPLLEREVTKNTAILEQVGGMQFVSTPDLLVDLPNATWLPIIVDTARWETNGALLRRPRPIVVHAPSHSIIKGTDMIDAAAQRLHDEGIIEYVRVEGVPHEAMTEIVKSADIVLDQFRLGSYGVAAVEAMAAGRLVVGHVHDTVRDYLRVEHDADLPIIESRGGDIEATLRSIAANPAGYTNAGPAGRAYAARFHDGTFSAKVLSDFLKDVA